MGSAESKKLLEKIDDATDADLTFMTKFFHIPTEKKKQELLKESYDKYNMRSADEKKPIIRRRMKIDIRDSELKTYLTELKSHLETDEDQKLSDFFIFQKLEECVKKWEFPKDFHEDMERSTNNRSFLYYNISRQGDKYNLAVCYLIYGGDIENHYVLLAGFIKEKLLCKKPISDSEDYEFYLKF